MTSLVSSMPFKNYFVNSALAVFALMAMTVPLASAAIDVSFDSLTEQEGEQGLVSPEECAQLNDGLAGALGCDTTDRITDFTEFDGELEGPDSAGYDDRITQAGDLREFIKTIVNFALGFLGLASTVIIIYGGGLYVLSRGDEDMASKGKTTIQYAATGIIIILASFAITNTLINATGGSRGGGTAGGGTGQSVVEAGESFEVDTVLAEMTDIADSYVEIYDEYLFVSREVAALLAIEMPLVMDLETADFTLGGLADAFKELVTGQDSTYSDKATLVDDRDVEEYLDDIREGALRIQSQVDSLSETHEKAQAVLDYLRSGKNSLTKEDIQEFLAPTASALTQEEFLEELSAGNSKGDGCADRNLITTGQEGGLGGLGGTVYAAQVQNIDDEICPKLASIQTAADADYLEALDDLVERFVTLQSLFDTSSLGSGTQSDLKQVSDAFEETLARIERAKETVTAQTAREIIQSISGLFALVENMEFVNVQMRASVTEGNAPLIVRFDILNTEDPSGKTVKDEQIYWDLDGDGAFNILDEEQGKINEGEFSRTSVSFRYDTPGVYRARVRVVSSESNIASGVASITINVGARKSQIKLDAVIGGERTVLADYSNFPVIDKPAFKVTMAEGKEGITFDASKTTDGNGNLDGIISGYWDFGDGETLQGEWAQQDIKSPIHQYGKPGVYTVTLDVTDKANVHDRKILTLYVASPAARLTAFPLKGVVGTTFKFDGSASSVDIGTIVDYKWNVTRDGQALSLPATSSSVLSLDFTQPGIYLVSLTIRDSSGKEDSVNTQVLVESQTPVPRFTYVVPEPNRPAVYVFDASSSYDPDEKDALTYTWEINGGEYEVLKSEEEAQILTVEFKEVAPFEVILEVADQHVPELRKSAEVKTTINVENILDITLSTKGKSGFHLDDNGEAEVELIAASKNATAIEVDYGDGTKDFAEPLVNDQAIFTHNYETAGVFYVKATAFDDDNNQNSTTHRVYVAVGDSPIAVIEVGSLGTISQEQSLLGSIKTKFNFDASKSINVDGSANGLTYSWNFGDGIVSNQKTVTHSFDERGSYEVTLTVKDSRDPKITNTSTVNVDIEGIKPKISRITVAPAGATLETPLKVNVNVEAADDDGRITYYKAWYYDVDDSAEELGTVIAQSGNFSMVINTKGVKGEQKKYAFAVEVTDNDNQTVSSFTELLPEQIPTLDVTNGPNETPVSNFSVDRTAIMVGESVTFSATSFDSDGTIVNYWWDVEGDGFFNNEPQADSTFVYTYTQIHSDGVDVKLKVEDSAGATAESAPITIFVDADSEPPEADFIAIVDDTTVSFTDKSIIDTFNEAEFADAFWDFNSDGKIDGSGAEVEHDFGKKGSYKVTMTIVDSTGQTDEIQKEILIADAEAPTAEFDYDVENLEVSFRDRSETDTGAGVGIQRYEWDFNDDGEVDSIQEDPDFEYEAYGEYRVTLVIVDEVGQTDSKTQTIQLLDPLSGVKALLTSVPEPNGQRQIVLSGDRGDVTLYYSAEGGSGRLKFDIDKNIFLDSNGDGIRDNDIDYTATTSGSYRTAFSKAYGQTVVKLTVSDLTSGEKGVATLQVVFEGFLGSANLFNVTPKEFSFVLVSMLIAVSAGLALSFHYKPTRKS